MKTLSLEVNYKIELPRDWVTELGLESGIVLEKNPQRYLNPSASSRNMG